MKTEAENKTELTVAVENFCSSRTFRVELIEAVVRETVAVTVREAMDAVPDYREECWKDLEKQTDLLDVEAVCDLFASKVYDIMGQWKFGLEIQTRAHVLFHNEFRKAMLAGIQAGDTLKVERMNVETAGSTRGPKTDKKIRAILPCALDGRVLIVWGTRKKLRVHQLVLKTGKLFQMTDGRRGSEYYIWWADKGKNSGGETARKIDNSNPSHAH